MKNIFNKFAFFIALSFVFISCGNLTTSEDDDSIPQGKGKITISTDLDSQSRSVLPTAIEDTTTGLKWELEGTCEGKTYSKIWNDTTSEDGVVTTAYNKMKSANDLLLDVGTWNFTLKVKNNSGYVLFATKEVSIETGENKLSFEMKEATSSDIANGETVATGSIEFTLNFPGDVVTKGIATLTTYEGTNPDPQEFTANEGTTNQFLSSITYKKEEISAGYYILKIELQQEGDATTPAEEYINTYSCLIRVAPGLTSKGVYTLDELAQLYTVTYNLNEGTFDSTTSPVPTSYNAYTSFELPEPTREGYEFVGWYTDENLQKLVQLDESNKYKITQDITLYAKWKISWDGLKNQIEKDSGISEFVITEDLTATSTITVSKPFKITSDKNVTITRGNTTGNTSFTDAFFEVEFAGNLELEGKENSTITLDGGNANESPILATAPLITSSGNLTLTNCTLQNNKNTSTTPGGAIYISAGKFTMNGGIIGKKITGSDASTGKQSWQDAATDSDFSNYAYAGGGGIYVASGDVTIKDAKVSHNYVPDDDKNDNPNGTSLSSGGGICMNKGTLTLENSEVSYNRGYLGGGVRCYNDGTVNVGTLTLKNATIKGNAGKHYAWSNFGGALAIRNFDVICDKSAEASIIEENYSADGGAVFLEHTTSTLENIIIRNNSFNDNGYKYGSEMLLWDSAVISIASNTVNISNSEPADRKGIFINNSTDKLKLSGDISLNSPINLHFESGQSSPSTVTVAGNLSGNNVATIYLVGNYTEGTQVLVAENEVNLADQVGKFTLKNENYKISDEGTVVSKSGGGGTVNPDVTVTSWSTLKSTIESIDTTYTEENPYVIEITSDITTSADTAAEITVSSHVKLVSNTNCIITRTSDFAGVNLFQVNTEASLTIGDANAGGTLTLDGGGTDVSATKSLVNVTGTLVLNEKSVLQNNNCPDSYATSGAAVFSNGGTLKVFGSTIKNNSNNNSSNYGGAIYIKNGTLNITSGTFEENKTNKNGGAIYVTKGTVNITGGNFINNKVSTGSNKTETSYGGGAIYIDSAETSISAATFESNITEDGVGTLLITNIGTETSPAMIYNCTFTNNTAYQNGAAIYTGGNCYIEINNCTFTDNTLSNVESHDVYIGNTGGTTKINGSAMTGAWTSSSN